MKYLVDVNGSRHGVETEQGAAAVDGGELHATLDPARQGPVRTLRIGDRVVRVVVHSRKGRGQYALDIEGHRYNVEALGERARAIQELAAASAPPAGPAPVIAPMPGLVVRVNVGVGDTVVAGQGVLVMEAMKMENELRASSAATVKSVRVTPGTVVEKGTVLIEMQ
ncbi:MAG: acetyl-CoA carboxylase biotin carboxyl carrier protein subunit [Gemmatimonadaceae bacterium]